jgi:FemAB-related protein (PEP-CTERM system-associated)
LEIRPLTPSDDQLWDAYVHANQHGSPFHLTAWKKTMEEIYGYSPRYLLAMEQGSIRGVLPLFLVQNFLMGKVLISSPFAVYGGILADTEETKRAIGEQLIKLGKDLGVQHIELRNAWPDQTLRQSNVDRYVTFTRDVTPDEDSILADLPFKKRRNTIRKSLKSNLSTRIQHTDYRAFEDLHSRTLRRLGTPNFPPHLFPTLLANFAGMIDIREVLFEAKVVAASMNFYFRDQMHTYYAASDPRYLFLVPNDFMYYDHLRWAGKNGYGTFDFGRSKVGSGSADYKRYWGATMRKLPYEILLVNGKRVPNFSPQNPKFDLAIKVWQRLPLPLTRALGPHMVRLFP